MSFAGALQLYSSSWILWAILLLGLSCYLLLFTFILGARGPDWRQQVRPWLRVLPVLLSALPLLGLLGTITGLMKTFRELSGGPGALQQGHLSSGIAEALLSTQLGLVLVVPGLLLLAWLRSRYRQGEAANAL